MERDGEEALLHRVIREGLSDEETLAWNLECNGGVIYLGL